MFTKRIIPCLDVNKGRVVKGVNFVDLKDAGDPVEIAKAYDAAGADELVFLDITASCEERDTVVDMVRKVAACVFIPFTVGGGIRTVDDFKKLLRDEHFSDHLYTGEAEVQIISDATDPNMATMQAGYAANIISMTGQEMLPPGVRTSAIVPQVKLLYNPQMKSAYNFVPGVMGLILMMICAMMTSISIVREKETGTMEVLLVSPVKPLFIILAKAVPYFVLSFVNLITILLLSVYVLHVPVAGSLFWLVVVSLLFIFVSLALGLLISTVTHTQVAAMLVSGLMLMMPTMLLSGMIFPVESMPVILQSISTVIPARWYIQAVRKLMIEGVDISLVLTEIGILAVMAVLLITVSFKKFKNRLE